MNIKDWIVLNKEQLVKDVVDLVNIPSVYEESDIYPFGMPCKEALDKAISIAKRLGYECVNHENYCASFLWEGDIKDEIGIFGHLDVVPAGPAWEYEPFDACVVDDLIIGRGSSDNKGSLLSALYALKYLKDIGYKPYHSIRFFFGCNEESGMEDIAYYCKNNPMPKFSFTPDAAFPVCNGEKGILELQLEYLLESTSVLKQFESGVASNSVPSDAFAVLQINNTGSLEKNGAKVEKVDPDMYKVSVTGKAAHAAFPEGSESAEVKLAQVILSSNLDLDSKTESLLKSITEIFADYYGAGLGIGEFEDNLSGKTTHIGGLANLDKTIFLQNINIRYSITADRTLLKEKIKKIVTAKGFTLQIIRDSKPNYVDKDSEVVKEITSLVNEYFNASFEPYIMGGGTYARMLDNAIGFGPGNPNEEKIFGINRGGGHQPDEYIAIKTLEDAVEIYSKAIMKIDEIIK